MKRYKILVSLICFVGFIIIGTGNKRAEASSFYGEATPLNVGTNEEPISEEALISSVTWSIEGIKASLTSNSYKQTSKIGVYYFVVSGTDGTTTKSITNTIEVVDTTKPTAKATPITIGNDSVLSDNALIKLIEATDNSLDELTYTIIDDEYSQTIIPGIYSYTVRVSDAEGNYIDVINTIEVLDTTAPTITGTSKITTTHKLSKSEILAQYIIKDDVTEFDNLIIDIEDSTKETEGTYTLNISVIDEAGNVAAKTITIVFIEQDVNVIYVANRCLVSNKVALNLSDLQTVANYILNLEGLKINSISSDYLESPEEVGTYEVVIALDTNIYNYTIEVYEEAEVKEAKKRNLFVRIMKWIYNHILTPIGHFFMSIGKCITKFFKWLLELIF